MSNVFVSSLARVCYGDRVPQRAFLEGGRPGQSSFGRNKHLEAVPELRPLIQKWTQQGVRWSARQFGVPATDYSTSSEPIGICNSGESRMSGMTITLIFHSSSFG